MIYLDSAATTLEKPESVARAMASAVRTMSSPGRGSSRSTRLAEETDYQCRKTAAELFGVEDESNVVFTMNATHGLNLAISSLVKPWSKVIISGYEHNAVTRPLHSIEGVRLSVLDTPMFCPDQMLEELKKALQAGADVCVCNHVSNVFGCVQPVEEVAELCREAGVPFILDASQSAGVVNVNMKKLGAAYIAMPGHKGLYGPQGTGLLLCGMRPEPLLKGGTGSLSRLQSMPEQLPDRVEAGTHNMPGIAGLLEGMKFVRSVGIERIYQQEKALTQYAVEKLKAMDGVSVFHDSTGKHQAGVVSFIVDGMDCENLGEHMAKRGIALRAGLHCAPVAHRTAKTLKTGTVRLSTSYFTRKEHIDHFATALQDVIRCGES